MQGKKPEDSAVINTQIILPSDTNALGTVFGGKVMAWLDIAAAISAGKHARRVVVTASMDAINFVAPARLGQVLHIKAQVNYAARTSMEVGIRIDSEDLVTGHVTHTATAYSTFVALDSNGKPTPVPPILPQTAEEKRRFAEAQKRREARMRLAAEIKAGRSGG